MHHLSRSAACLALVSRFTVYYIQFCFLSFVPLSAVHQRSLLIIMAVASLLILFSILILVTLWKRFARRETIPTGLKELPGPKGMLKLRLMIVVELMLL